ncbi:MAG: ribosome small subunit-dependent GTPase A [Planctomycetes bacterium]|nr:ribosome small subunit-dependent GTPase A [Planctomycetota bacterium]
MVEQGPSKYKGTGGHAPRAGMGRLRRANAQDEARVSGWENRHEDDAFVESHGHRSRRSHGGEALLAKFNRLADEYRADLASGEAGDICGFAGKTALVRDADGTEIFCEVRQVLKKRIAGVKNPLCIGDYVRFTRAADSRGTGVIDAVSPRRNQLARTDSHNKALMHVFAANIDRLVVVSSLSEPDLKHGLIDRYLLIAAYNGIAATVVLTKTDLRTGDATRDLYATIGIPTFAVCALNGNGIGELRAHLSGLTCVFAGQSGVGKSSLVNALFPDIAARVGDVANAGHGRHTTTSARSYVVAGGGHLIDTPGIRECGITGMTALDVALLYPDLAAHHPQCRFDDCSHLHEPDCAVQAAVIDGKIAGSRYESYRSIVREDLAGEG